MGAQLNSPQAVSPHLKSGAASKGMLYRELASALVLTCAACFIGGAPFIILTAVVLLCVFAGNFIFQAAGLSVSPRWDISLFHQALILSLFVPKEMLLSVAVFVALAFVLFYRLSGGRSGYVIQPVCLALAFLQIFGMSPAFQLEKLSLLTGGVVAALWLTIRFPRTLLETRRMAFVFSAAILLSFLQQVNFVFALVWSFAAGELIFDSALMPLSKTGRMKQQVATLILFALLLVITARNEAMLLSGLAMSFFAGWIENSCVTRKAYALAK